MKSKADTHSDEAEKAVRDIKRATHRLYSAEYILQRNARKPSYVRRFDAAHWTREHSSCCPSFARGISARRPT
jgi:hypothetical protein